MSVHCHPDGSRPNAANAVSDKDFVIEMAKPTGTAWEEAQPVGHSI
ncbi:hypothetical protein FHW00_002801 [Ochrobactrum sp. P6BSIII]|nr:hypothetical protein [Ochrobactrum sp. P6BSIII]